MMRVLIAALALLAVSAFAFDATLEDQFVTWQVAHGRVYSSQVEFALRVATFKANALIAGELSAADPHAEYDVTKSPFADMSAAEFRQFYLLPEPLDVTTLPEGEVAEVVSSSAAPTSYDWREKNAVTPVYNQGQCGSCWAFSATETVESYWFLAGKPMTKLSMQQTVDCDTTSYGCNGGWTYSAYKYIIGAGGVDTLASYPYTAQTDQCNFNSANIAAKISGWKYVTQSQDENAMVEFLYANGPLSICVDASSWQFYSGGVISTCGKQIDHCVQATGYSVQGGVKAWNVRNSWGTAWGNEGYLYVQRGTDMCAIAQVVTAVTADTA